MDSVLEMLGHSLYETTDENLKKKKEIVAEYYKN